MNFSLKTVPFYPLPMTIRILMFWVKLLWMSEKSF